MARLFNILCFVFVMAGTVGMQSRVELGFPAGFMSVCMCENTTENSLAWTKQLKTL